MQQESEIEGEELTVEELSEKIHLTEKKLESLRDLYLKREGVLPPRTFKNADWRWTIFMTLGIAYITFIVYFLGIVKAGQGEGFGIPDFLYGVDVQYYAILTFFIIFGIANVQNRHLRGYQVLTLFLGFWCAHWLIYDWSWWFMDIGFQHQDMSTFWAMRFYAPLFMENPPMWLFLTEALVGAVVSVYTFSIPNNYKTLFPPAIWLYTVYMNASVCSMLGLSTPVTIATGIVLTIITFGIMIKNSIPRVKEWKTQKKNRTSDSKTTFMTYAGPLGTPYIYIFIALIILSYIFLIYIPLVGFILGMVSWYGMPLVHFVLNATPYQKLSKTKKILIGFACIVGFILMMIFLSAALENMH